MQDDRLKPMTPEFVARYNEILATYREHCIDHGLVPKDSHPDKFSTELVFSPSIAETVQCFWVEFFNPLARWNEAYQTIGVVTNSGSAVELWAEIRDYKANFPSFRPCTVVEVTAMNVAEQAYIELTSIPLLHS